MSGSYQRRVSPHFVALCEHASKAGLRIGIGTTDHVFRKNEQGEPIHHRRKPNRIRVTDKAGELLVLVEIHDEDLDAAGRDAIAALRARGRR